MSSKTFKATATITNQCQVTVTARDHTLTFDEPKPIGGDTGMTPLEGLLSAIGACKSIVAKMTAKNMGIDYQSLEIIVEGDFDSRGYQGNPEYDIGFSNIRTTYHIDSQASEEKLKQLIEYIDTHCPAAATIKDSAPMKSIIKRKA